MNSVQIFKNEQFGEIRTVEQNGEILFIAADICKALELGQVTNTIRRLDEDEKALISIKGINKGNDKINAVNEYGLYNLVLSSRKPEAKAFKRWITHEVIPAIRKTGKYAVEQQALIEEPPKPTLKYYGGIPVITIDDFVNLTGVKKSTVYFMMKAKCSLAEEKDYYILTGERLKKFKQDNKDALRSTVSTITVLTESGVIKLCKGFKTMCKENIFLVKENAAPKMTECIKISAEDRANIKKIRKYLNALDIMTEKFAKEWTRTPQQIEGYKIAIWEAYISMMPSINALTN